MDGRTKVYGIIANPVEHSMSPVLHNLYGEQTGVDLVYVPFKVKEEALQKAVEGAFALNVQGQSTPWGGQTAATRATTPTSPAF